MDLKQAWLDSGLSQSEIARRAGVSVSAVNLLIHTGRVPKDSGHRTRLSELLGVTLAPPKPRSHMADNPEPEDIKEETPPMLTLNTLRHFRLAADPFVDDINSEDDVYRTDAFRDLENSMRFHARSAGILCIIGESGSGKSVARDVVTAGLQAKDRVNVIFPRSFEKDKLSAVAICQSIIDELGDGHMVRGMEARARQVEQLLCEQVQSGARNVLIIEEAHDLNIQTLKFLKRFWEMKYSFKRLVGIILIGQPEIKSRLQEVSNWSAREFIRRATTVELPPYSVADIRAYLDLKFKRLNRELPEIFTEDAFPAIERRLVRNVGGRLVSNAYPLLINNVVRRALNEAAENAMTHVNADIITNM